MKKKFVSLITVVGVLLSLMLLQQTAMADYTLTAPTSGSGTAENPYQIANAENLAWFAGLVNGTLTDGTAQNRSANAVLTANIDLNPGYTFNSGGTYTEGSGTLNSWTPIGYRGSYEGTFDGANYTISGLYIGSYESDYCGLFGYSTGTIKNIKLDNSYISSTGNYVGGVCGCNYGTITSCGNAGAVTGSYWVGGVCGENYATIENCYNTGTVSCNYYYVGGVCGYNGIGTITNCSNTGAVSGDYTVGGVCGENDATIENCYNTGTVTGSYVGGVCGRNGTGGSITNCSNTGAVSGGNVVGGVCGENYATIENCYNTGTVTGSYVGGVCGENDATIENCYNTGTVTGSYDVGGVCGDSSGTITNCYYLTGTASCGVGDTTSDTAGQTAVKTAEEYESGEVCYLLNGDNQTSPAFGQLLSGSNADKYPVFCDGTNYVSRYIDDSGNTAYKNHSYINGICTECGEYEVPSIADGTYQIANAGNLYWFAQLVNGKLTDGTDQNTSANAVLTADIDLNPGYTFKSDGTYTAGSGTLNSWTPIGISYSGAYKGTFDGANYTISGLYIGSYESDYCGLFGFSTGTIKNIKLDNSYISSTGNYVGGVCGYSYSGSITNCSNSGNVSGTGYVGGVCGFNGSGTITSCGNAGAVSGTQNYAGGVCGFNGSGGTITNCSNSGNVSGTGSVGGVSGANYATIENCSNSGTVTGNDCVGGVCGYNYDGTITSCGNAGAVKGTSSVGGVCGYNDSKTITNCSNTGTVKGTSSVGGVCGYSSGTITNCYYLSGTADAGIGYGDTGSVTEKTDIQYASGEVCYLLNGDSQTSPAFGQLLSGTNVDAYPVLYDGTNDVSRYTDDSGNIAYKNHSYTNGICTVCGGYEVPSIADGTYQIANAGNLYWFAQLVNGKLTDGTAQNTSANAVLTADIDLNPGYTFDSNGTYTAGSETLNSWTPIGTSYRGAYKGTFDGANYTISGLYIGSYESYYCGLFGYSIGTIKNIKLDNSYIYSSEDYDCYVGGVCGFNEGTITSCSSAGTVSGDGNYVGGVCGFNYEGGTITSCSNSGTVSGYSYVGGVCSENSEGTITNCYNTGTVTGAGSVGGVCGKNSATIENCYNTGTVTGSSYDVGGVCGVNEGTITSCSNAGIVSASGYVGGVCGVNYATIENCYNTGTVTGDGNYVGGVCGENSATIENCYNTGAVSASGYVGGVCGFNNEGTITNCYYLSGTASYGVGDTTSDTERQTTVKTAEEYASGEVCYLLNADTTAWYQNISTTENDKYPVLDSTHKQVYSNAGTYSNIEVTTQTSSKSEDANKGDYAYGYVTNINTNDCTVNSLIWNVSAVNTDGNEAKGTVTYNGNTSGLRGNIKVGLILTKTSNSVYTIKSVSAYVE